VTTSGCVDHVVAWETIEQPSLPRQPVLIPLSLNTHLIAEGNSEQLAVSLIAKEHAWSSSRSILENEVLYGVTSCSVIGRWRHFEKT
jgi:hypothetical protein